MRLYGPPGFLDKVQAKLSAYTWNLVARYENDFSVTATEVAEDGAARRAVFRVQNAFRREGEEALRIDGLVLLDEPGFRVRAAFLDHRTPSLAFALEEKSHVNIWKNRLAERGLPVGPWLQGLKRAVLEGLPPETRIEGPDGQGHALAELMACLEISPGLKYAYVTDAVFHERNAERIQDLAAGADVLFIEAVFAQALAERAREKCHLTAAQAGWLGHRAGAKALVAFHHSPIYRERVAELAAELEAHFRTGAPPQTPS